MVAQGFSCVQFHFLDQGLHRTPNKMAALIQEQIDLVGELVERVDNCLRSVFRWHQGH